MLEISTDGGNTFQYVLPGAFLWAAITVPSARSGKSNCGLQAWSGNSEGFITTVVNLAIGVPDGRLRWRMASDTVAQRGLAR